VRLVLRNAHFALVVLAQLDPPKSVHVALGLAHLGGRRVVHEARRGLGEGREGRFAAAPRAARRRTPILSRPESHTEGDEVQLN